MELKKQVEVSILVDDKKNDRCDLRCPFNYIPNKEFPDMCYCDLFHKNLKSFLSYEDYRTLIAERCQECINQFNN